MVSVDLINNLGGFVRGSNTFTGDGATVNFTITHSLGLVPKVFLIQSTSSAMAAAAFISSKTATNAVITFVTAPVNAANITVDWIAFA